MNPSQAGLERAQALRQRTRTRTASFQRSPEREQTPFPIVLRGYDRAAVDEYVEGLTKMIADLEAARSPHAAVREALDRVGEETSAILQQAHETAEQITSGARLDAQRCLEAARRDSESLRAQAERQARTLASDSDSVWNERGALLDDMRRLAESILEVADTAAERITSSPAASVRAAIEAARAEGEAAGAQTSIDADPVAPDELPPPAAHTQVNAAVRDPELLPGEEPRVWREPQPTEAMDPVDFEDDPDGVEADDHPRAPGPHGPYWS